MAAEVHREATRQKIAGYSGEDVKVNGTLRCVLGES